MKFVEGAEEARGAGEVVYGLLLIFFPPSCRILANETALP